MNADTLHRGLRMFSRQALLSMVVHLSPRAANALLFIYIARTSGAPLAGVLALAITYQILITAIPRGLDDLLIREIARRPETAPDLLMPFLTGKVAVSGVLAAALTAVLYALDIYPPLTRVAIAMFSASALAEAALQCIVAGHIGLRRYAAPAAAVAAMSAIRLAFGLIVPVVSESLLPLASVYLLTAVMTAFALLIGAGFRLRMPDLPAFRKRPLPWGYAGAALTFMAITALAVAESQIDTVILSAFHDRSEIAFYGAATTVAFSTLVLVQGYRLAVFPVMSSYALQDPPRVRRLHGLSMRGLLAIALPTCLAIAALAPPILKLLFGATFLEAVLALRIICIALFFVFVNEPNSRALLAEGRQVAALVSLLVAAVVNLSMNLMLIPAYGAQGAAVARACSSLMLFAVSTFLVLRKKP